MMSETEVKESSSPSLPRPALSEEQQEIGNIVRNLRRDHSGRGCSNLGLDGVFRTLTTDGTVIDAIGLNPRQIKSYLDRFPYDATIEKMYRGVDGSRVPREKWFNPDKGQLPPVLSPEEKAERRKLVEERKRAYLEEKEKRGGEGPKQCCPIVRSDYNLESRDEANGHA